MFVKQDDLLIRNAAIEDAAILGKWWRDGAVMAHAGFPKGLDITDDEIAAQLLEDTDETRRRLIIQHCNIPIGEMSYYNKGDGVAEIGIKICDFQEQEKGYGTKLLKMLISTLFHQYGYTKIILDTNLNNKRAQHVYEKLGFRRVRVNADSWKNQVGELQSSVDYEMSKTDFENQIKKGMLPKRLSRTTIYESPWVNLYVDKVIFPDGALIEKHHILDFPRQAAGVIVENDKTEILLIHSYRYTTNSIEWEIPAGGIEDGEGPCEAAKREVLEETGYDITEPQFMYSYNPSNGISNQTFNILRASAIGIVSDFDRNEVKEVRWFSVGEIRNMISEKKIKCGLSLTALLLYLSNM